MHTRALGQGLEVSAVGLGCMGMSQSYGPYVNEELAREALAPLREEVVVATKFGWDVQDGRMVGTNSRPEQIRRVADESLQRLGIEVIELAQQPWMVPIPGTRRRGRIDENAAATRGTLSAGEVADLDLLASRVLGDRYDPAGMAVVGL